MEKNRIAIVRNEEIDGMARLNSALDRLDKGEVELAVCDIKHAMGCVARMMHQVNSSESKV